MVSMVYLAMHSPSIHPVIAVKRSVGKVEEVQCWIVLAWDTRQGAEGQGEGGAEEEEGVERDCAIFLCSSYVSNFHNDVGWFYRQLCFMNKLQGWVDQLIL